MATDPRWVNIVEKELEEILTDHAYCEQKAASNAITLIVKYPEYSDLVIELTRIVQEEVEHFGMVHQKLLDRGFVLGRERKDPYVHDLMSFTNRGGNRTQAFVDRMLFSAMIEARSCERFRLLSEEIKDEDLKVFYRELMHSEANHYATFLKFAKKYGGHEVDVDKRWKDFLEYEGKVIATYGVKGTMHG